MADMQKVSDFLTDCGVFYLATCNDDAPALRPVGFKMVVDGKLYLGLGKHKDVYAQISATPKVCICATKKDGESWIRINADVELEDDAALVDKVFEEAPYLKPLYEENGWEMGVVRLASGTVTYYEKLMAPVATEEI